MITTIRCVYCYK